MNVEYRSEEIKDDIEALEFGMVVPLIRILLLGK